MLDGQFDFPFKRELCSAVFTPGGRLDSFASWSAGNDGYYGATAIMTTWIGNHDIPRAIHFASRQIGNCTEGSYTANSWDPATYQQPSDAAAYERLAIAFAIMMTSSGIPLIYYGDEIGLAGGGDPDNRRLMPWNDGTLSDAQKALRAKVRALARLRGSHHALGRGFRMTVAADQDTWVYQVGGCGPAEVVTVAINRSDGSRSVNVPAGAYVDLINGGNVNGGALNLAARSFLVLGPR
jgi:glycosidase